MGRLSCPLWYTSTVSISCYFALTHNVHRRHIHISFKLFTEENRAYHVVLSLVGLDTGKIKQVGVICGQESTRRIGDYKVKYGYTDIDLLR